MNFISKISVLSHPPRVWTQAVFWLVFFVFGFYLKPISWEFWPAFIWAIGNTLFFFIAVNVNLYFLLPKFMFRQSFLSYLAVLLALALLLTPFITMFNIWLVKGQLANSPNWMSLPQFHFVNLLVITALSSLVRIPLD